MKLTVMPPSVGAVVAVWRCEWSSEGWTLRAAAAAAGVSVRCARKWVARYRLEGESGLPDRSSAPRRVANRTAAGARRGRSGSSSPALQRRRDRRDARYGALHHLHASCSALVWGGSDGSGSSKPFATSGSVPGELVHVDVKRLRRSRAVPASVPSKANAAGRNSEQTDLEGPASPPVGYECVHVCVDDYSRLAYAEVLPDERPADGDRLPQARGRLLSPTRDPVERLLTDNGLAYLSARARARLSPTRHPPPAHTSLSPTDQRPSRALHPHARRRLGLQHHLPLKRRTHRSA